MQFRSWLPTVSGRLSFSSFGHSTHPNPTRYVNRGTTAERFLVCSQRRVGIDAVLPFPNLLSKTLWDRDGDLIYVALCKSDTLGARQQEALVGHVYILQNAAWGQGEQPVSALMKLLDRYSEADAGSSLGQYIQPEWDHCNRELDRLCAFHVGVEVCRSGKTTIDVADADLSHATRPSLGTNAGAQAHFAHRLAAQIFYFLRDLGHHHQHHDPSTDTIVDLFPFDGKDDLSWRQQVLYNIYRTIIQYKRNPRNRQFHASLGLLAYASTFHEVSVQELPKDSVEHLPYFHNEGLERSLSALQAVNQLANEEAARIRGIVQNIILWVVGIVISVIGLLQVAEHKIKDPSDILIFIGRIAVQQTEFVGGLVAAALFLTMALVSDRWHFRTWRVIQGAFRLVAAWPKPASVGVLAALGFAIVYLLYLIARYA